MMVMVVPVEKAYFIYCVQFYCLVLTRHPDLTLLELTSLRFSFFWDFTLRRTVFCNRRFGKNYGSHLKGSGSPLTLEDETNNLSRKVSNKLSFHGAKNPERAQISQWGRNHVSNSMIKKHKSILLRNFAALVSNT
jgi:hypothetical protein